MFVSKGKPMSLGLENLMWKLLEARPLNTLSSHELRYLHLLLCKMYDLILNVYLLREALANTGNRDFMVLGRKVPIEYWKILWDVCLKCGCNKQDILNEERSCALWYHLVGNPSKLEKLVQHIFQRFGIKHFVLIDHRNLKDGNFLYNLGSVLPSRLLMVIGFCLVFWGREKEETWVRFFVTHIFIVFLLISGHLHLSKDIITKNMEFDFRGIIYTILKDIHMCRGTPPRIGWDLTQIEGTDYLFLFNNDVIF